MCFLFNVAVPSVGWLITPSRVADWYREIFSVRSATRPTELLSVAEEMACTDTVPVRSATRLSELVPGTEEMALLLLLCCVGSATLPTELLPAVEEMASLFRELYSVRSATRLSELLPGTEEMACTETVC